MREWPHLGFCDLHMALRGYQRVHTIDVDSPLPSLMAKMI
jgi:hypothetical protein